MELADCFPLWSQLTPQQQAFLSSHAARRRIEAGTLVHDGGNDCTGLLLVEHGQLRAYALSDEGCEITLYRLLDYDLCLLSAPCALQSIQFDVTVRAEKDTSLWIVQAHAYRQLMEESVAVANYTNEVMASRFSEVMWLMEQILWKSFDKRLAAFLLDERALEGTNALKTTHESIANHLGTAREVVTRMLRYFQSEGLVELVRGTVRVADPARLGLLANE